MTRLLLALLLLQFACAADVPLDKIPKQVRDALEKRFPGARIFEADIDKFGAGGKRRTVLTYELRCWLPDRAIEVLVTEDGTVLDEEFKEMRLRQQEDVELSAEDVREDLAVLRRSLEERFAYLDYGKAELPAAPKKGMRRSELAIEVQKAMARFIDGHAEVSGLPRGSAFLPFLVESAQGRFVAFKPDRSGFVEDGFPWIESIDGRPMKEWVEKLEILIPQGSPAFRTRQALRQLRALDVCRKVLGDKECADLEVVLSDGTKEKRVRLALSGRPPVYGPWPRPRQPGIDDGVGYLPLPRMDERAAAAVREWMPRFRDTRAIVVDVRGNGGGTREALLELHPWLSDARVASVAKHRLAFPEDHLDARFMTRADDPRLSKAEQVLAKGFLATFKPEWEPPAAKFSDWHVLILKGAPGDRYQGKVFVLMDDRCFSATDIFLGALKGLPNVTLVGRASGGGSGFKQAFTLPRSGIEVRCASMASFTPQGRLYDLHGIEPDVTLEPEPDYFLESGRDATLEEVRKMALR